MDYDQGRGKGQGQGYDEGQGQGQGYDEGQGQGQDAGSGCRVRVVDRPQATDLMPKVEADSQTQELVITTVLPLRFPCIPSIFLL